MSILPIQGYGAPAFDLSTRTAGTDVKVSKTNLDRSGTSGCKT